MLKMSSNTRLPTEILRMVIQYLPRYAVYEWLFVNKLWNMLATQEYFKKIFLTDRKISALRNLSLLDCSTITQLTQEKLLHHAEHVHYLEVYQDSSKIEKLTVEELFVILYNMPNLKVINLHKSRRYVSYLNRIVQFKMHQPLITSLEKIILPTAITHEPEVYEKYYTICSQNSSTLTHLQICPKQDLMPILGRIGYSSLDEFLSSFPKLVHLQLLDVNSQNIKSLFHRSLFATCPGLTHLSISCDKTYYVENRANNMDVRSESLLEIIGNCGSDEATTDQCYNLREFSITAYYESAKNIYAFIEPHKHLKELKLQINNVVLDRWDNCFDSNSAIFKLSTRIKSLPYITLDILGDFYVDNKSIQDVKDAQTTNIVQNNAVTLDSLGYYINYYHIINQLLRTNQPDIRRVCKLKMDFSDNFQYLSINKSKTSLSVGYFQRRETGISIISPFLSLLFGKEKMKSTTEEKKCVNWLPVNMLRLANIPNTYEDTNSLESLWRDIISSCPFLVKLDIEARDFNDVKHSARHVLTSTLDFLNDFRSSYLFREKLYDNSFSSPNKLCELYYADERFPSQEFLQFIQSWNFNVTDLDIRKCLFFVDEKENPNANLRVLQHLEYLKFDIIQDSELRDDLNKEYWRYCDQYVQLKKLGKTVAYKCLRGRGLPARHFLLEARTESRIRNIWHNPTVITITLPNSVQQVNISSSYHENDYDILI